MAFPEARMIETNAINMAVYERGEGLPVIFSHGFPELAYSWRHQLDPVAAAGYRAVAPDQRGYGLTDAPPEIEDYDIEHLTADLIGLLDEMGEERAIFAGHDWGGILVWDMPKLYPDRVAGVIGVNTAYIPHLPMDPIELFRQTRGEDNYIVQFQTPGKAEAALEADVARAFRFFMRSPAPGSPIADDGGLLDEATGGDAERPSFALLKALELPEELWGADERVYLLNDEETDYYVSAFERTGFRGGINWYRNFSRNWKLMEGKPAEVNVPCLMISAEKDAVLPPAMADGMEQYCPDTEKHVIADCGHWTQQEKPDELNALIVDWLQRRFPQ